MAITFLDPALQFYGNGRVLVGLVDSNNSSNVDWSLWPSHSHLDWIEIQKQRLTHKWENTIPTTYYPHITFVEATAGQQIFRSTVDCTVLDSEGKRDISAEEILKENEKQRYIAEQGMTEE